MRKPQEGFTLLELMIATTITLGIGLITFQLFRQNERVFRDQNLILEMQQTARAVASLIADELRMAGQGVPVYSSTFDTTSLEAVQWLLDGSDSGQIRFRSGSRNVSATVTGAAPFSFASTTVTVVSVDSAQPFANAVQASTRHFAYVWGPTLNSWAWVRAQINSIDSATNTITVTPTQYGTTGAVFATTAGSIALNGVTISLEEGVSFRFDGNSIRRGFSTDLTSLTAPTFIEEEIGRDFAALGFNYYDAQGNEVTPDSLSDRALVRRVNIKVVARTSEALSNGARPTFAVSLRIVPRNGGIL